ncbi:MAG: urea amidolyase, partial [Paracoccaceae bacterium]
MARLKILSCGAHASIQDFGRPGYLAQGLSKSGAADCLALEEGAVLLGQVSGDGALEMAGFGGVFQAQGDMKIALTGAPMKAELDGTPLAWN